MADKKNKLAENAPGKFYVDDQCIDCDACRETAPDFFKRNDERGYSFVYRQPQSPDDVALSYEALEGCPVEAIGDDGDEAAPPPAAGTPPAAATGTPPAKK